MDWVFETFKSEIILLVIGLKFLSWQILNLHCFIQYSLVHICIEIVSFSFLKCTNSYTCITDNNCFDFLL